MLIILRHQARGGVENVDIRAYARYERNIKWENRCGGQSAFREIWGDGSPQTTKTHWLLMETLFPITNCIKICKKQSCGWRKLDKTTRVMIVASFLNINESGFKLSAVSA